MMRWLRRLFGPLAGDVEPCECGHLYEDHEYRRDTDQRCLVEGCECELFERSKEWRGAPRAR